LGLAVDRREFPEQVAGADIAERHALAALGEDGGMGLPRAQEEHGPADLPMADDLLPRIEIPPLAVSRQRAARTRRQAAQDLDAVQRLVAAFRDRLALRL